MLAAAAAAAAPSCGLVIIILIAYAIIWLVSEGQKNAERAKIAKHLTLTWSRAINDLPAIVKTVLETELGYIFNIKFKIDGEEIYQIGSDIKVWKYDDDTKPEQQRWAECTRKIHIMYHTENDKTSIDVSIRLGGQIVFNESNKAWFLQKAEEEINRIGPLIDQYLQEKQPRPRVCTPRITLSWPRELHCIEGYVSTFLKNIGYSYDSCTHEEGKITAIYCAGQDDNVWHENDDMSSSVTRWAACTRKLYVRYIDTQQITILELRIELDERIVLINDGMKWFLQKAQEEFDHLGLHIDNSFSTGHTTSGRGAGPRVNNESCASDTDDTNKNKTTSGVGGNGLHVAYERLGLKSGATWQEVQAAYRTLCKQYHPDMASSKNYPPHIVALMEEKFRTITDAYDQLRSTLGGR